MTPVSIAVVTDNRQTRRQVARALRSGGLNVSFFDTFELAQRSLDAKAHALLLVDGDNAETEAVAAGLERLWGSTNPIPVVLLSLRPDNGHMLKLLEGYEISHLIAKHGAIRVSTGAGGSTDEPVYGIVDEHELLVTCDKLLTQDVFGIEKYIGLGSVAFHRRTIRSMKEKGPFLDDFEKYLSDLECPATVIPDIVTVAEEFLVNAMVHAPRRPDGTPKYEDIGPAADLVLEPHEAVEAVYGCDGQRLMLSVSDNFGGLQKKTLYDYLHRAFELGVAPEAKPSGAGLGLAFSLKSIHQLVFNVQESVRTEAIAGWYLRVRSAKEFKRVGKSLNLFWLPVDAQPVPRPRLEDVRSVSGRIDESFDSGALVGADVIDLRGVTRITSRGVMRWMEFIRSLQGKGVTFAGLPEVLVSQAAIVSQVITGISVRSVMVPFECSCEFEDRREVAPAAALTAPGGACPRCGEQMQFAGFAPDYEALVELLARPPGAG